MGLLDISDTPDKPRPRNLSFFLVAFLLVLPLRAVAPLSWMLLAYWLYTKSLPSSLAGRLIFAFALSEALFSLYHSYLVNLAAAPWKHGAGNIAHLQISFSRVLKAGLANLPEDGYDTIDRPCSPAEAIVQLERDDPRSIDFRNTLRTWFHRAPWSSIRRTEVEKWIYWSIFNTDLPKENLPEAHRVVLEDALGNLEKRLGTNITLGSNPKILPMRMTLDKMHVFGRPFFYYALIFGINWYLSRYYAKEWNLRRRDYDGLEYLLHVPRDWNRINGPRPIVFLHGLGLGLFQYHRMIKDLYHQFPDRPLLIPLQPHVSQDIFHPRFLDPICRHDLADRLAGLMTELGWIDLDDMFKDSDGDDDLSKEATSRPTRGVTMLSHSNGSYLHAWCLKRFPQVISRSCFVDPVTFCSWEGDVCYNFLYKPCRTGIELLMRFFVGTELGVANLLRRHFDWSSNAFWYEEIPNARDPRRTFFLLGGKDDIIDAGRVKKYLTSHGLSKNIWFDPTGRHGQALLSNSAGHREVMRWLQESP